MEDLAVSIVKDGGVLAVLFVVFLLAFGYCFFEIKSIKKRLEEGDSAMKDLGKELQRMASDVSFIRGLLEGKKEACD